MSLTTEFTPWRAENPPAAFYQLALGKWYYRAGMSIEGPFDSELDAIRDILSALRNCQTCEE